MSTNDTTPFGCNIIRFTGGSYKPPYFGTPWVINILIARRVGEWTPIVPWPLCRPQPKQNWARNLLAITKGIEAWIPIVLAPLDPKPQTQTSKLSAAETPSHSATRGSDNDTGVRKRSPWES